jgi:YHS domain-containing protein
MKKLSLMFTMVAGLAFALALPADARAGGCARAKSAAAGCGCESKAKTAAAPAPRAFDQPPAVGAKATCPVMGAEFTVAADSPRAEHKGKHYAFCCSGCKPKFDKDPAKFAGK